MNTHEPNKPNCFGRLEVVFPKGADGLRHSPAKCMGCVFKTECLRTAMQQPAGREVESEMVDRAYDARAIGFVQRWAKKKALHQRAKQKKEN